MYPLAMKQVQKCWYVHSQKTGNHLSQNEREKRLVRLPFSIHLFWKSIT
jgi:hypothetical protein